MNSSTLRGTLVELDGALAAWTARAIELGWLTGHDAPSPVPDGPSALFDEAEERPLVVGLFGGTGVGKSSLLNRIAGEDIARASAERPTSRGVTAYLHRSRRLDALPSELPLDRLRTALHHEPRWRDVLFLDMPDIDSVETGHHELVERWLPHLDVVLYVVSPERYRDDRGWRLLTDHAGEHAWLFVMNQWDRSSPGQLDDWRAQLGAAGFADPQLHRTVAAEAARVSNADDFTRLTDTIERLADRQLIDELERRGTLARLERQLAELQALRARALGPDSPGLAPRWRSIAATRFDALHATLAGRIPMLVARSAAVGDATLDTSPAAAVFDSAARARLDDAIDAFVQTAREDARLPRAVLERVLGPARRAAEEALEPVVEAAAGQALARPGTRWQRAAHAVALWLTALLPLAALGWAGWRVLDAFRRGGVDPAAYLGTPFAITAGLLVALAWALPWLASRRLEPSRRAALARGLEAGARQALAEASDRVADGFERIEAEREDFSEALKAIADAALPGLPARWLGAHGAHGAHGEQGDGPDAQTADVPPALRGLLAAIRPHAAPTTPSLAVRATAQSDTEAAPLS